MWMGGCGLQGISQWATGRISTSLTLRPAWPSIEWVSRPLSPDVVLVIRVSFSYALLLLCFPLLFIALYSFCDYRMQFYSDRKFRTRFLGAFTKLRKATISFVMSVRPSISLPVCLSVRMEQLGSDWMDFHEI